MVFRRRPAMRQRGPRADAHDRGESATGAASAADFVLEIVRNFFLRLAGPKARAKLQKGVLGDTNGLPNLHDFVLVLDFAQALDDAGGMSLKNMSRNLTSTAEKEVILRALQQTQWNRKQAASMLNVSYKTLLNKIRKLDIK